MSKPYADSVLVTVPPGTGLPQYQHPVKSHTTVGSERQPYVYGRSVIRRFIAAFLVAVGFWAILRTLLAQDKHRWYWTPWANRWDSPSDLVLGRCVGGPDAGILDGLRSSAETSFGIPLCPSSVLMVSRYRSWPLLFEESSSLSGSLDITTSTRLHNTAEFIIHSFPDKRDNIEVCPVTGSDGQTGIGIFEKGSGMGYGQHRTFMKISLVLPRSTTPLQLKGIVAGLPNFSINVGNLKDAVEFESASLKTSNAAVSVESLTADYMTLESSNAVITTDSLISSYLVLETSNAPITGNFNTSGTLHLTTSNAPITVTVNLKGQSDNHYTRPPTLVMRTSNKFIDAKVNLFTNADKGGIFHVAGTTSNGPLTIEVPESPVESELGLTARTSNAVAEVTLHGAYQGRFLVKTSNFTPELKRLNESGDARHVEPEKAGDQGLQGYVYLEEANKKLGRVHVTTSNAHAVLFV
ncbi:hypothetical protein B0H13DRAFT_2447010 [Mycena leptocephala]|nr:hypothetical protein B0H13DRAFT_2447010 [Mycena leptocephala]